jgi:methionine sulfoxide reductase heme-binding subunit
MNLFALRYIRKIILILALLWAVLASILFDSVTLVQVYAFSALFFLYTSLLVTPLYIALPKLPGKALAIKGRRATGLTAFVFVVLHASTAFYYSLGGFVGIQALAGSLRLAFFAGLLAAIVLLLLAATSSDEMVKRLGKRWKPLHRLVYIAAYLILFHASVLGSHFLAKTWQSYLVYSLVTVLLCLEAYRFNLFLVKKEPRLSRFRYLTYFLVLILFVMPIILFI